MSRADDFDVRRRGAGGDRPGNPGANGGTVNYNLGYDAQGWDTDGFRSPEAGVGTAVRPGRSRGGSHARTTAAPPATGPLRTEPEAPGPEAPGPGAPGPEAPGPEGPGRRRGRDRARVKVKGSWWRHWTVRKVLGVLLSIIGAFIVMTAIVVVVAYEQTPVPTAAMAATGFSQSVVYSANGSVVGRFGNTNRTMLNYDQIPKAVIDAVLAAEDRGFMTEGGVSPSGIMRAAYSDIGGGNGSLQGGSTITQQFVRNYYGGIGTQQTLSRKIKEIFVAMKIGKEKSKQWILENYLNTIYLGEGAYGIGAAAETYYNEPVSKLTLAQAAVIAAIIQQPGTYPLPQYRVQLQARWHYVLNGLVQMGKLSQQRARSMKFPVPRDHVPQTVGHDVWDPYVLAVVYGELRDVYHLSPSQIDNGGYVIKTTIDDAKMAALYRAVQQNEGQMAANGAGLRSYMHVGAVLENPANGAIEAMYGGPGYPAAKYNGVGHRISVKECNVIHCQLNTAIGREQVGSSFKPYILATAVKQGMNVQTSMVDGQDFVCIPPDSSMYPSMKNAYPDPAGYPGNCQPGWYPMSNDSTGENAAYTAQQAMTFSVNTAYGDLWHYVGGANVVDMAQRMGVDVSGYQEQGSGLLSMEHQAGVALGQASLSVAEQATMLATIDDGGVYHNAHVIASITQLTSDMPIPVKLNSYPVFSSISTQNAAMDSQVQYAMGQVAYAQGATGVNAGMSDGRQIISKTGTTNTAESAFFIGAVPQQALAVGIFTSEQDAKLNGQSLNGLGGAGQGGFGGTWPALIWHSYAENMFLPLPALQFPTPVFSGQTWTLAPKSLLPHKKKKAPPKKHGHGNNPGGGPGQGSGGNPNPYPTYSCDPTVVTCGTPGGNAQAGFVAPFGAVGGIVAGLPVRVRRRRRKRSMGAVRQGVWTGGVRRRSRAGPAVRGGGSH